MSAITSAMQKLLDDSLSTRLINVGGPDRVSRLQLAHLVAQVCKLNSSTIESKRQADVSLQYPRPPDLSLDITCLRETLQVRSTPLQAALEEVFSSK